MEFTKSIQISGIAIFSDFENVFDSVEWDLYSKDFQVSVPNYVAGSGYSPKKKNHLELCVQQLPRLKIFFLQRGERQSCLLSRKVFVIANKLLVQSIRRYDNIKGNRMIQANQEVKLTQHADDTTTLLAAVDVQSVSNVKYLLLGSLNHQINAPFFLEKSKFGFLNPRTDFFIFFFFGEIQKRIMNP